MEKIVEILKALSDPTRLRILMSIENGELCVCQITELIRLAPSTISKHISILKHAGIIKSRKEGRWIYYSLSEIFNIENNETIEQRVVDSLKSTGEVIEDRKKLLKILKLDREILCKSSKYRSIVSAY